MAKTNQKLKNLKAVLVKTSMGPLQKLSSELNRKQKIRKFQQWKIKTAFCKSSSICGQKFSSQ